MAKQKKGGGPAPGWWEGLQLRTPKLQLPPEGRMPRKGLQLWLIDVGRDPITLIGKASTGRAGYAFGGEIMKPARA